MNKIKLLLVSILITLSSCTFEQKMEFNYGHRRSYKIELLNDAGETTRSWVTKGKLKRVGANYNFWDSISNKVITVNGKVIITQLKYN